MIGNLGPSRRRKEQLLFSIFLCLSHIRCFFLSSELLWQQSILPKTNFLSQNDLCSSPRQTIQYHGNISLCLTDNAEEAEVEWFYEDLQDLLELTPQKDVLFIIGDWNTKVGSQKVPGVTGKFGLRVQNEAGKRLIGLSREGTGHSKHPLPTTQYAKHGHHQMANTEIRLIIFFFPLQPKTEKLSTVSKNKTGR